MTSKPTDPGVLLLALDATEAAGVPPEIVEELREMVRSRDETAARLRWDAAHMDEQGALINRLIERAEAFRQRYLQEHAAHQLLVDFVARGEAMKPPPPVILDRSLVDPDILRTLEAQSR